MLETLINERHPESDFIIRHYTEMLRRHIVPDRDLQDIARQLYQRHKEAFDFVFECRPTPESLMGVARDLMLASRGLLEDHHIATNLRFIPQDWDDVAALNTCPPTLWTKSGRTALFEIKTLNVGASNFAERVNVALVVGPANAEVREALYKGALARPMIFKGLAKPMGKQYSTVFSRDLLTAAASKDLEWEQKVGAVTAGWKEFVENDLPALRDSILEIAKSIEL